jgi:hypothetical protein
VEDEVELVYPSPLEDRTVHPDLLSLVAEQHWGHIVETSSGHVPMLSNPGLVLDVIRKTLSLFKKPENRASARPRQPRKALDPHERDPCKTASLLNLVRSRLQT